jgi:hypothetical protein
MRACCFGVRVSLCPGAFWAGRLTCFVEKSLGEVLEGSVFVCRRFCLSGFLSSKPVVFAWFIK